MTDHANVFLIAEGYHSSDTGMTLATRAKDLESDGHRVTICPNFDTAKSALVGLEGPRRFVFFSEKKYDPVAATAAAVQRDARVIVFSREVGDGVETVIPYETGPKDTPGYPLVYATNKLSAPNLRALVR